MGRRVKKGMMGRELGRGLDIYIFLDPLLFCC